MENYDPTRSRPEFEAAVFEDLAWLGLRWEEPVLMQSTRFDAYAAALAELEKLGLLYPAFMSRGGDRRGSVRRRDARSGRRAALSGPRARLERGAAQGGDRERRTLRASPRHAPPAARASRRSHGARSIPSANSAPLLRGVDLALWGDVLLARKEVPASYHLAVVVDDAFQRVTDVVRGRGPCGLRPPCIASCNRCSTCRSRVISIID